MRTVQRAFLVIGMCAAGALSPGLILIGCGDDNGTPADGGGAGDATTEGGPDALHEVGRDTSLDAAIDTFIADVRADRAEGGADVHADTSPVVAFQMQVADALCQELARCCFPDGGASRFDSNFCITELSHAGYENSSFGADFASRGNIAFNPDAAAACLTAIGTISNCTVTSTLQPQLITNCFGAYVGTLEAGASCAASIECAAGLVCDTSSKCANLRSRGQPCGDFADATPDPLGSHFCSYRASGNTGLQCNEIDDAGMNLAPDATTCQPQLSVGSFCNYDTDCVPPMICDLASFTCTSNRPLIITSAVCSGFILDAGGGG
jgi:hypothetical protein